MRRAIVLTLALLSIALTGGTCDFRFTSGNPPPPPPPKPEPRVDTSSASGSGVDVVVSAVVSMSESRDDEFARAPLESARSTSVLTAPVVAAFEPSDSASIPRPAFAAVEAFTPAGARPHRAGPANAVPEPAAFGLFGIGLVVIAMGLRSTRPGPRA